MGNILDRSIQPPQDELALAELGDYSPSTHRITPVPFPEWRSIRITVALEARDVYLHALVLSTIWCET